MTPRKANADDPREPIYTCIESFSCLDETGQPLVVDRGMRLRGGNVVDRFPNFFAPPNADDIEIAAARRAKVATH